MFLVSAGKVVMRLHQIKLVVFFDFLKVQVAVD
jgi:hypothetical protein